MIIPLTGNVLVSACLIGQAVRYDGHDKPGFAGFLAKWRAKGRLVSICPEMAGGLPVPRPPAEIEPRFSGEDVPGGRARIFEKGTGKDVTVEFITGAEAALALALENKCQLAILTEASPSCGSSLIYDGAFTGNRKAGMGVVTALLRRHGIRVLGEQDLARLSTGSAD